MENNLKASFQQQAARASWIVPILTIVLMAVGNSAMQSSKSPITGMIMGGVFIILLLAGVILGIIGCFGVKHYDAKSTLLPGLIGVVLSASILAILIAIAVPNYNKARETAPQKKTEALQKLADQTNKQLPAMVDADTRLDKIIVARHDLIEYRYTFVNVEQSVFDVEQFQAQATPHILKNYQTGDQFKMYRENRISIQFSYYDKNGELITNIIASANDASNK